MALALFLVTIEGVLSWTYGVREVLIGGLPRGAERGHAEHDPELGWVNRPNLHVPDLYGRGRGFTTNSQRLRATQDYARGVPPGLTRVLFLGDSFTMGFGVDDADPYPAWVERLDERIQSVNMGMGAYGVDQIYLAYARDGDIVEADIAVLAFIARDFRRMELDYFFSPKPRLILQDGELVTENAPVPEHTAGSVILEASRRLNNSLATTRSIQALLRRVFPDEPRREPGAAEVVLSDETVAVAEVVFEEFQRLAESRRQRLLLTYLPTLQDIGRSRPVAEWVGNVARDRGLSYLDLSSTFEALPPARRAGLFLDDGHYSALGNRFVGRELLGWLEEERLLPDGP